MQLLEGRGKTLNHQDWISFSFKFRTVFDKFICPQFSNRIVTAAHCLKCNDFGCPTEVNVYVGNVKSFGVENSTTVVKAKSWTVDETYDESSQLYDLATSKSTSCFQSI